VARRWQRLGPSVVVITLGDRGAFALAPGGAEVSRPAPALEIVDTVGAGDAFSSGLLDALAQRDLLGGGAALARVTAAELGEVIGWAVLIAALTCARAGADPPSLAEARRAAAAA
jgi:fructokinase